MEIYILGFGGWISQPYMGYTSIFVKTDINILIDVGECVYTKLQKCSLPWPDVIFISHRHGDHILGLPTFMLMTRRLGRTLKVVANKSTIEAAVTLAKTVAIEKALDYVEFIEAQDGLTIGDTKFRFVKTIHPVETLAVRIEHGERCLVYSSDTAPSDDVVELARGCNLLIHEASGNPGVEDEVHKIGHSTTKDAVEIALRANVKTLIPIHFYIDQPIIPPGSTVILPTECGKITL
ncbi:MAG: MBL fold metallo-hydrolase [Pyrobaculum sp.]